MVVIFGLLALACIFAYIFFRVKYFRIKQPYHRQWLSSKATISLGLFMLFFGIDQLFLWKDKVSSIVGIIFTLIGLIYSFQGYKMYKYFQPKATQEAEQQANS